MLATNCSKGFQCDNRQCIPKERYCDNVTDCSDNSDEISGCGKCMHIYVALVILSIIYIVKFCADGKYQCHSGECITSDYVCDGDNDCGEWQDKENCTNGI